MLRKKPIQRLMGTGIGKELSFLDIEIKTDSLGKPYLYVKPGNKWHIYLFPIVESMPLHRYYRRKIVKKLNSWQSFNIFPKVVSYIHREIGETRSAWSFIIHA